MLDFYGISWEYEPVEFSLEWDESGKTTSAFRPDFYLPDHRVFVEITTLRQDLVTRKNRKVRRLGELYPNVHVKVLYKKDIARLGLKYGLGSTTRLAG